MITIILIIGVMIVINAIIIVFVRFILIAINKAMISYKSWPYIEKMNFFRK